MYKYTFYAYKSNNIVIPWLTICRGLNFKFPGGKCMLTKCECEMSLASDSYNIYNTYMYTEA